MNRFVLRVAILIEAQKARAERRPLCLDAVDSVFLPDARKDWRRHDIEGVLCTMSNHRHMDFLIQNLPQLLAAEVWERALLWGYMSINPNMGRLPPPEDMRLLWELCDREKLRSLCDPIPDAPEYVLYRGVPDGADRPVVRGCSWTSDRAVARKFAVGIGYYPRPAPAVFRLTVPRDRVLAYSNKRQEQEYIVDVWPQARPVRVE